MSRVCVALLVVGLLGPTAVRAQQQPVPQPFPRPGGQQQPPPAVDPLPRPDPIVPDEPVRLDAPIVVSPPGVDAPTEQMLGLPIYPTARYLASYNAGAGQRYYLFGTNLSFAETVAYYRTVLNVRGDLVFDSPATHMFEVGRFDEARMAFPPGVTIKDYAWNGSQGYRNPEPGVDPPYFRTVIQIVPAPTASGRR